MPASAAFFATFQRFAATSLTFTFSFDVYFFLLFFRYWYFIFSPLVLIFFSPFSIFSVGNQLGAQVQVQVRLLVDFAYLGLNFLCLGYVFFFIIFFGKAKRHLQRAVKLRRWQVALHGGGAGKERGTKVSAIVIN